MLPISLRFQGLHSYKSIASIDFTKLVDARLFGIFGATGSGKSTILEAITLVLFSHSERLGSQGKSSAVNLSAKEMWIEFAFSQKDKEYLFEIKFKKPKNSDSDASLIFHRASVKENNNWIPKTEKTTEVKAYAEKILGIDADNFRRTTIIPQGKFQDFLTLSSNDRGEMMIDLFKLDQYNLSDKARLLSERTLVIYHQLEGQLKSIQLIDKDQIANLEQELINNTSAYQATQVELAQTETIFNQYEQLAIIDQQHRVSKDRFDKLIGQKEAFEIKFEEAKRYERSSQTLNPILDELNKVTQKQIKESQHRTNLEKELTRLVDSIAQNNTQIEEITPAYNDKEKLTQQVDAINKAIEWHKQNQLYQQVDKEVVKFEKGFDDLVNLTGKLNVNITALQQELTNLQNSVDGAAELEQLKAWYQRKIDLVNQQKGEQHYWNEIDTDVNNINKSLLNITKGDVFVNFGLDAVNPEWDKHLEQLQATLQEKDHERASLDVRHKLVGMAHTLIDGQPCPLCGAIEHPEPLQDQDLKAILADTKNEINQLQAQLKALEGCKSAYEKLKFEQSIAVGKYQQPKAKLAQIAEQLELHYAAFVWQGYQPEDMQAYSIAIRQLDEDRNTLKLKKIQLNAALADLEKTKERVENGRKLIEDKKQEKASLTGQLSTLANLVDANLIEDWKELNITQLQQDVHHIIQKKADLERRYIQLTADATRLSLLQNTTQTSLAANETQLKEIGAELTKVQINLTRALTSMGFSSQSEAEALLAKFINFEHVDADYQAFKSSLQQAQGQVLALQQQLEAQPYDNDRHGQLLSDVQLLRKTSNDLNGKLAQLKQTIDLAKDALKKREQLIGEKELLENRLDQIKKLQDLFKGKGFVHYISRIYLEGVVKTANIRFKKMTRNQLAITLKEGTDFYVTDYLNEGKVRPIKTLSGGQTFQAALCLALSLSELIAAGENQFFFLDEGFGTQDKDALQEVVKALESLQKEGRVVGIISHVEELKQLLDVSLLVSNDPISGSTVSII